MGYTAEAIANYMTLLGWSVPEGMGERFTLAEAAEQFSFDRVNKAGARFDWDKLNWLNAQVLHGWSPEQLLEVLRPLWIKNGWTQPKETPWTLALCELLGPSLTLINDGVEQAAPFFECPALEDDGLKQLELEGAKAAISHLLDALKQQPWMGTDLDRAKTLLGEAAKAAGVKKGVVMKSLRAALLGRLQGPDLLTTWSLLAQIGEDLPRLQRCLS
jgi:glutamyl-tRNA synthetase